MLDLLIGLTQMMVEGELLQLERIGKIDVTEADYMELVDRKTACLFSACARLGAHQRAAPAKPTKTRLGEYAWNLGMAFQLIDDMLDFTSREKILGKPVGNDLREGKVTLPLIYALESAEAGGAQAGGDRARRRQLRSGAVRQDSAHPEPPWRHRARRAPRRRSPKRPARSSASSRIRPISGPCSR